MSFIITLLRTQLKYNYGMEDKLGSHPFKNDKVTNNILNKKYKFLKLRKEHRGNDIDYFLGDFKHEKKNLINHYFNPKKFITAPRAQYSNIKKSHTKSELINVDKIILNKIKIEKEQI